MTAPLVVNFELTRSCNLRCRYCHVRKARACVKMSPKEVSSCIEWLGTLSRPVHVFLTGGEPLLHPQFTEWLAATERFPRLTISISTNGTILSEEIIERMVSSRIGKVLVSFDGWDASSYEWHSGTPGTYRRVVTALRLLVQSPLCGRVVTNTVLTHANVRHWRSIADVLVSLGVNNAKFSPVLVPADSAEAVELRLRNGDIREYQEIRQKMKRLGNESFDLFEDRMCRVLENREDTSPPCYAGSRFVFVRCDGNVFPCWQLSDPAFKIRYSLREHYDSRLATKLYLLDESELAGLIRPYVEMNRDGVCRDCCDACNLFMNELWEAGRLPDGPAFA